MIWRRTAERRLGLVARSEPCATLLAGVACRCCVRNCNLGATYRPVLHLAQVGRESVSRVDLPVRVCASHRGHFVDVILGAERRLKMEDALRSQDRAPPDWARTTVEFVQEAPAT